MEAACERGKPHSKANQKAMKIPTCAAAPKIKVFGLAINGPKSVRAPIPKKMIGGSIFQNASP